MSTICEAPTVEAATTHFGKFAATWRETYPAKISS